MYRCSRVAVMLLSLILGVLLFDHMFGRQGSVCLESLSQQDMVVKLGQTSAIIPTRTLNDSVPNLMVSTCSDQATKRGPNQRVVSFSFYGQLNHSRHYFEGIEVNSALAESLYPGWIVRIYHDIPASNKNVTKVMSDLQNRFKHLDICNCRNIPGYQSLIGTQQNIWRFLPMADPLVDVLISRDLDSRISVRERVAVEEWLLSGLAFHVMRDNAYHNATVLAGMWGVRVHTARELLSTLSSQMLVRGRYAKTIDFDQSLLADVVWPVMKGHVLQHDSYHCMKHAPHGHMRPWPTRRKRRVRLNYVGSRDGVDTGTMTKCPSECRPTEHQDWTTC